MPESARSTTVVALGVAMTLRATAARAEPAAREEPAAQDELQALHARSRSKS